jgi:RNA polymerase primary sigma factor
MGSRKIVDIDESVNNYFNSLKKFKSLKKSEEQELLKDYFINKNLSSRNLLIQSNLKYACSIANSYRGKGVDFSELISEANNALIDAIEKFDLSKDVKIITYAKWWIIQRLNSCIYNNNITNTSDIPNEHEEQGVNDDGEYETAMKVNNDAFIYDNIDSDAENEDKKILIEKLLSILNDREREIVSLYYGLYNETCNLEDIGDMFGLTKERIRQIIETSFKKIRSHALLINV